jgi:hypothetical protein
LHALEDRYAVVSYPDRQLLARGLRPLEAAAYVETYNRLLRDTRRRAAMIPETPTPPPAELVSSPSAN